MICTPIGRVEFSGTLRIDNRRSGLNSKQAAARLFERCADRSGDDHDLPSG